MKQVSTNLPDFTMLSTEFRALICEELNKSAIETEHWEEIDGQIAFLQYERCRTTFWKIESMTISGNRIKSVTISQNEN